MKTEERTSCPTCKSSNNLSYFKTDSGHLTSKCMTPDCPGDKASRVKDKQDVPDTSKGQKTEQKPLFKVSQLTNMSSKTGHTSGHVTAKSGQYGHSDGQNTEQGLITTGSFHPLTERGVSEATCRRYNYQTGEYNHTPCHIANYLGKSGDVTCQKIRLLDDKSFRWQNNDRDKQLFGQQALPPERDILYITEGEIDCLSLAELGLPAVSISTGAGDQTEGEILRHMKFLSEYEKVVLVFDTDDVGQKTQKEIAKLFTPGQCYAVKLRHKDPNEYLKLSQAEELRQDLSQSELCRPDNIIVPSKEELLTPEAAGMPFKYPVLSKMMKGIKPGRIITLLAGSGIGKTTFTREIVFDLVNSNPNLNVGVAYLEEPPKTSGQGFIALATNTPLHELEDCPTMLGDRFDPAYDKYVGKQSRIKYVDASFMKLESKELVYTLNWLAVAEGCSLIVLDHLTMVTYDMEGEQSERKDIDMLMKALRQLTYKTRCTIILISHLKRPFGGKSWEEGRAVQSSDARGSAAIEQLSDYMLGLEGNIVSEDPAEKNKRRTKVMKNRVTGQTGYADDIYYQPETGRMKTLDELFK